jgi:hypothetical protein
MFCVQEFSSMMVEVERDHAERRINTLQQHYKRRRLPEQDEEVSSAPQQCCGSGMFIPDPDFYPSRIQHP